MSLRIFCILLVFNNILIYFPDGSSGKESACNAGNLGSIPGLKDPQEKEMSTYSYFCLENPMDRGPWWATVHGVAKSWTRLSD